MAKLFENLWVKVAAIILAILLWFHVATDKVYQNEITIPLSQVDLAGDLVLLEPPPDSVTVTVSATGKTLLRTDWKKRGARLAVNLSRAGKFKTEMSTGNLSLVKAEKVELIDVIAPREVFFSCDWKGEKEVPVKSRVVVLPDEGYAVDDNDSLVPGVVRITGPRSLMATIDHVETVKANLENVRNNFTKKIAVASPDVYGMSIEPDSVVVFVGVVPIRRKVLSDVPIKLINSPPKRLFDVAPRSTELTVAGKADAIDSLTPNLVSAIADYVLADGNGVIPVQVIVPPAISLLHKSVDSVRIAERQ